MVSGSTTSCEVMVEADLEAGQAVHREPVEVALFDGEDEHGEGLGREALGTPRAKPGQHLALRDGQPGERRDQLGQPRAGRDDEPVGRVGGPVGAHPHPVTGRLPIQDLLVRVDLRAVRPGQGQVRGDAAFRVQEAAVRLQESPAYCCGNR